MKISGLFHGAAIPALFAAIAIASAGCGDKAGTPSSSGAASSDKASDKSPDKAKIGSCNVVQAESLCREYGSKNVEAAGEDFLKKTCDGLKGQYKSEACPKDKRVGSCVTQEGTKVFYSEGGFPQTADQAQKACKEGVPAGEWKAGQ